MEKAPERQRPITAEIIRMAPLMREPEHNPRSLEEYERYLLFTSVKDYPGLTPKMWAAVYEALGFPRIAAAFLVTDIDRLPSLTELFRRDPCYIGGGAGYGLKERIAPLLDELDEAAFESGSVNFITKKGRRLIGHNTDGEGFALGLVETIGPLDDKTVILIGAGGTARAIGVALGKRGAKIRIVNRTIVRGKNVAKRLNGIFSKEIAQAFGETELADLVPLADVVVNTTTKADGPYKDYSALGPIEEGESITPERIAANRRASRMILTLTKPETILVDVVLGGGSTMLRQAKELGVRTQDGLPMVVNQGAHAFSLVHGEELAQRGKSREDVRAIMDRAVRG